jgi:hypothetical protein
VAWFTVWRVVFLLLPTIIQVVLVALVMRMILRFNKLSDSKSNNVSHLHIERKLSSLSGGDNITPQHTRKNQRQFMMALCHIILWSFIGFGIMTFLAVVIRFLKLNEQQQ